MQGKAGRKRADSPGSGLGGQGGDHRWRGRAGAGLLGGGGRWVTAQVSVDLGRDAGPQGVCESLHRCWGDRAVTGLG